MGEAEEDGERDKEPEELKQRCRDRNRENGNRSQDDQGEGKTVCQDCLRHAEFARLVSRMCEKFLQINEEKGND